MSDSLGSKSIYQSEEFVKLEKEFEAACKIDVESAIEQLKKMDEQRKNRKNRKKNKASRRDKNQKKV